MLDILLFIALGIVLGTLMGLIPGIHPNMIVLILPFILLFNIETMPLIAFVVSLGISNSVVDFIPSILLGAPDEGTETSVLPGHRMLMKGEGYSAIKLSVIGSIGSVIFIVSILPLIAFLIPIMYTIITPIIYLLLLFITLLMILTENGKKLIATFVFLAAGSIGIMMNKLPIDNIMLLFPIFSGFFGLSVLLIQSNKKTKIPKQKFNDVHFSRKSMNRSVVLGSLGGIFSGFLPGIGSSEVASITTIERNDKAFLVTVGALATANVILSLLSLWLIAKTRSGLAVVVDQISSIGVNEIILMIIVALITIGIISIITLKIAKSFLGILEKVNYMYINLPIIFLIVILTIIFTGHIGVLLLVVCSAIGIFTNLCGIKRGNLMGVLILPTMLFYAGF